MKVSALYRPATEQEGKVQDYVREYHSLHPDKNIELISLDTLEGSELAKLYDITRYPAIIARADNGSLLQLWQDEHLPLFNEISAYN